MARLIFQMKRHFKRNLLLAIGLLIAVAAMAAPFAGIDRFSGDVLPMLTAVVGVSVAIGLGVAALRPGIFEQYVRTMSIVFVILMVMNAIGMLANNPTTGTLAAPLPFMVGGAGSN